MIKFQETNNIQQETNNIQQETNNIQQETNNIQLQERHNIQQERQNIKLQERHNIKLQEYFELYRQVKANHLKVQLQISLDSSRYLKTCITIKKYPFKYMDIIEKHVHQRRKAKLSQVLEGICQIVQKNAKISTLFLMLPLGSRMYLSLQILQKLFCQIIDKQKTFLTNIHFSNLSIRVPFYLFANYSKFMKHLRLNNCQINQQGIKMLGKCDLKYLDTLDLSLNKIRNGGLQCLAKADWPKLKTLSISDSTITLDGLKPFLKARFVLNYFIMSCEDEQWYKRLIGVDSKNIIVHQSISFVRRYRNMQAYVFVNKIAKKQAIEEDFNKESQFVSVRQVFRSKIKTY